VTEYMGVRMFSTSALAGSER